MKRALCLCDPSHILAGNVSTWKFLYTTATALPKGTKIRFEMTRTNRKGEWEIPNTDPNAPCNKIWGEMPNKSVVHAKQTSPTSTHQKNHSIFFDFSLPNLLKIGETFTISLGTSSSLTKEMALLGNRAQTFVQRRKNFFLHVSPKGDEEFLEAESFCFDVRGNVLKSMKILVPSLVAKNKRFDVLIRFEDDFGNLTHNAPENTLIEVGYALLRETLSWKLFVPETGIINLPNFYFNEVGFFRIRLRNLTTSEEVWSPPIQCTAEQQPVGIHWGLLCGSPDQGDCHDVERSLKRHRDELGLQYSVILTDSYLENDNSHGELTAADRWKTLFNLLHDMTEAQKFVLFAGAIAPSKNGNTASKLLLSAQKDVKAIFNKRDLKGDSWEKIHKGFSAQELLSIPFWFMQKSKELFLQEQDEKEPLIEIYSPLGSLECLSSEGNTHPVGTKIGEQRETTVRYALSQNQRVGFIANGFDPMRNKATLPLCEEAYRAGLTAILATEHTKESLWNALRKRHCYATTGARIILGFFIAGKPMGEELSAKEKPGLGFVRHITGYVAGTALLKSVQLIRNGELLKIIAADSDRVDFEVDDADALSEVVLSPPNQGYHFAYYYLRVEQSDGEVAWSSPIWVNHENHQGGSVCKKKTKKGRTEK